MSIIYPYGSPAPRGAAVFGDVAVAPAQQRAPMTMSGRLRDRNPIGIEGRVKLIREMIGKSIRDPGVSRHLALAITHACPWRDGRCELEAIWEWMHRNIRYTGDVAGYDTFQTARRTIQYRGGDCDDGMTLIATLAMGNGFYVKGRITANEAGGTWAHIYPLVGFPKNNPKSWVPLDWTLGFHRFGAHPPQARSLEFDGHQIKYSPEQLSIDDYMNW